MGFTNYLLQAFNYVGLITFGPRLLDTCSLAFTTMTALVIYSGFIFLSHWWFRYFLSGPIEWVWRSITYCKFQSMRLRESSLNKG
jgi:uncharacterized protein